MARPLEFDQDRALTAAMNRFWAHGYEATSVRDLAVDMGISGASLYNTFGNKRSLYRRTLGQYVDRSVRDRIHRCESLPPLAAIEAFLGEIVQRSIGDRRRRGCMLVNAAFEMAPHDPDIRAAVAAELAMIEAFFCRCVLAGQHDGGITTRQPAADLARLLLGTLVGLRGLARTGPPAATLQGVAQAAVALLEPA